jgi:hypothetical protein
MMAAVRDGMYVSDEHQIYFLSGGTAKEFILNPKLDVPVFPGGFCRVGGDMLTTEKLDADYAVFMLTSKGIFVGSTEGMLIQSTKEHYVPTEMSDVTAYAVSDRNKHQVIFIGAVQLEAGTGEIELRLPNISMDIY